MALEILLMMAMEEVMETMEEATPKWTGGATKYLCAVARHARLAEWKPHVNLSQTLRPV